MKSPRPDQRGDETTWRLPPYSVEATFVTLSETVDWGLSNFGIPDQWRDTRGGGVRVAVIDTGIEASHPDLADSIDDARDFSGSPFGSEDHVGHGTHVAGTIAARQNDQGVVGVAPECRLLVAKVLGDDGSGSGSSVADGIDWACEAGADVLSMSLGSPVPDRAIRAAIQRAVTAGKFVVCAAGNEGRPDSVNFPARWPETLAIGAVDRHGRVARLSSRGEEVDVCAPGQDVLSTYLDGGYAKLSGTSMATPFVSGVVALLIAKHRQQGGGTPIATQQELVDHLRRTAIDAGPQGKDPNYGYGLIDPRSVLAIDAGESDDEAPFEIGPVRVNGVEGVFVFMPR
ncbi:MAG: S8 family peptidase [Planctomycetales bacterium]|nr:S8 family peptidase [Planctomycetales bacterium]